MKQLFSLFLFVTGTMILNAQNLDWVKDAGAKSFPESPKIFSVNKYGAVKNSNKISTKAKASLYTQHDERKRYQKTPKTT